MEQHISNGTKVRVDSRHWLRGGSMGKIQEFDAANENKINRYLVQFDDWRPDGGIDGDKLWLSDSQFKVE